jgi:hydroxyethylthiazole kinase-like sugar kinase family protein
MTNNVVTNDSANVTLALGASPIMATNPKDVRDLSKVIGGLLVNFGWVYRNEARPYAKLIYRFWKFSVQSQTKRE